MRRCRRSLSTYLHRLHFSSSSSSSETSSGSGSLYSFLQPSIFKSVPPKPTSTPPTPPSPSPQTQTQTQASLESTLVSSLQSHQKQTDLAWRSFKSLTSLSLLPSSPSLSDSLISHLASLADRLSLKRAFAASIYLLEKSPHSVSLDTFTSLFQAFAHTHSLHPALALFRAMLKNRRFPPFSIWGPLLIPMAMMNDASFRAFLRVFEENCQVALDERMECMRPDLDSCNQVLDGCCRILGSVSDAEKVLEVMSSLDLSPDLNSFGSLAYLYAFTGNERRIDELHKLMNALGYSNKKPFFSNLISGYVRLGAFESVSSVVLRALKERREDESNIFEQDTYIEIVKCFLENGKTKEMASLIIQSQELEACTKSILPNCSVGFGMMSACVELGHLDKAHNMLDEMSAQGASIGLGVYSCILKSYCKEQRTAEAAQLVAEINNAGLRLDSPMYDALIDASMTCQDFQSAFSLFREMREAMLPDLKTSYLTIMTGLTENNRPELMASFLDSVVDDPRIQIATHDWNSIIHAFCKVGRLEDAKRTYRRMAFLRFQPNKQTYLSLINGYVSAQKYFNVLMLWTEVRRHEADFDRGLVDAFLYALVKGGFFDAAMQVVEKANELKIYVDKWRHKQAFMENHKKLTVAKLRRKRNYRKMEALVAFKNWAGLTT
ncbi:Pentatricopeptide repeat-containing protein [Rhynchospora pubera]|uniref:Pentatricopeptide repeat-containing protein n=1 Tax=Rhynchospora pubera TaxID=906938 RepID=A0AAV8ELH9_9POAL|nr:Pentatricopeptide repeat-containing protein [Rhynchospora pubera]